MTHPCLGSALKRRLTAATALGLVAVLAGACGGSSSGGSTGSATAGQPAVKLTVLLDWFPNPDHISLYTARQKGYFTEAGLEVTLQSPSSASDAVKLVSLGKVPLAVSYEPEVLISQTKGLSVTAVAALIPTTLESLIISGRSGISSPAGLAGKKVGTSGLDTDSSFLDTILTKYGVAPSSVKAIAVNTGLVSAITAGNVDAIIGGYRNVEGIQLTDAGLAPKVFPVSDAGVPAYDELVIIANTAKLKSDPAYQSTVRRFLAALAKGDAAAQASPTEAQAALTPAAKGYSANLLTKMVAATAPLLKNDKGFGQMDVSQWQAFADWMRSAGLVANKPDASAAVSTAYLPGQ